MAKRILGETPRPIFVTPKERDAVLAGLRLLQRLIRPQKETDAEAGEAILAIYTDGSTHVGLGADGIDALCDRVNR